MLSIHSCRYNTLGLAAPSSVSTAKRFENALLAPMPCAPATVRSPVSSKLLPLRKWPKISSGPRTRSAVMPQSMPAPSFQTEISPVPASMSTRISVTRVRNAWSTALVSTSMKMCARPGE